MTEMLSSTIVMRVNMVLVNWCMHATVKGSRRLCNLSLEGSNEDLLFTFHAPSMEGI